jgi:acyl carrier protein
MHPKTFTSTDPMPLDSAVTAFLRRPAEQAEAPTPHDDTDLFAEGILDSFSLLEYVSLLEQEYGIEILEADIRPDNFRSVRVTHDYLARSQSK